MKTASPITARRGVTVIAGMVILLLGAVEAWWQRIDYSSDAISYLDVSRAIGQGDWLLALNPYWSLGYPLLLCLLKSCFPNTPQGEWAASHVFNVLILSATWFAFLFLVRSLRKFDGTQSGAIDNERDTAFMVGAAAIFTSTALTMSSTWLINPDLLVCCLVFVAMSLLLRLMIRPSNGDAMLLGLALGAGYIVKAAFLVFAGVFLLVLCVGIWRRKIRLTVFALALLTFGVPTSVYAAALSSAYGRPTLGESGSLNYAWCVNKLQMFFHWQGGPDGYGAPIHPSQQVLANPPVFVFDKPFPVSYPPFFNAPYYYEGYRHFFSIRRETHAVLANLRDLTVVIARQPLFWVLAAGVLWIFASGRRKAFGAVLAQYWPALTVAFAGIATYVAVHVEGRYIASFVAILGLLIGTAIFSVCPNVTRRTANRLAVVSAAAALLSFPINERDTFRNLANHQSYVTAESWKIGMWMTGSGLHALDKVAIISPAAAAFCEWAHIAGLEIVGEMGNNLNAPIEKNLELYWGASATAKQQVLEAFRKAGAVLVLASQTPEGADVADWRQIPGTGAWVHWLNREVERDGSFSRLSSYVSDDRNTSR